MTLWTRIKNFFKRFWYMCLVPAGLVVIHLFTNSKKSAKLKEREKIQKAEIKEEKREIQKTEEDVKSVEQSVEVASTEVKETIKEDLKDKAVRDEKASKYLPNL